jgi:hypothetical protein
MSSLQESDLEMVDFIGQMEGCAVVLHSVDEMCIQFGRYPWIKVAEVVPLYVEEPYELFGYMGKVYAYDEYMDVVLLLGQSYTEGARAWKAKEYDNWKVLDAITGEDTGNAYGDNT